MSTDDLAARLLIARRHRPDPTSQTARHKTARLNRLRLQHRRARARIEASWWSPWSNPEGVHW